MKKFLIAFAMLALVSCAGTSKTGGPACPQAGLLPGASAIPIFVGDASKDNLKVMGNIGKFKGACRFKKDGTPEFQLEFDFLAKKYPLAKDMKGLRFPYFIAVLSPDETVLQKERFWIKIDFDNAESTVSPVKHMVKIPAQGVTSVGGYKVVFGFELTKDQLAFNRGQNITP